MAIEVAEPAESRRFFARAGIWAKSLMRPGNILPFLFVTLLAVLILFGPLLVPFSPTEFDPAHSLLPPQFPYIFGTDEFGRDIFSRIVAGARPTLLPAILSAGLGVSLGVGVFSGGLSEAPSPSQQSCEGSPPTGRRRRSRSVQTETWVTFYAGYMGDTFIRRQPPW